MNAAVLSRLTADVKPSDALIMTASEMRQTFEMVIIRPQQSRPITRAAYVYAIIFDRKGEYVRRAPSNFDDLAAVA
ncbi:hypothetical protein B0T21DRAFT_408267 [Apiosordaria backusii]|uniref:Uncharacterized protein n=1 Tax=Apiosordaria backusii TaxID=314023 RepID=A0AA40ETF5_9PEZI|nr:hypothetical protein B0T21DRAFT_408267 [Apiosordaria backusii]